MRQVGIDRTHAGDSDRRPRRHRARRLALLGGFAALMLAGLPSTASAFTYPPAAPQLGGTSATPTSNGATLHATIYPYGLDTHYHFEYGTTTAYGTSVPIPEGDAGSAEYPTPAQEQATISGLTTGITYHYRVVASNADGMATSLDAHFTTTGPPPIVSDEAAVEVTGTSFELKGSVNPNGSLTTYQFEYGTTTAYGSTAPPTTGASVGSGTTGVPVAQTVGSLLPNTPYHFRLAATNAGGTERTTDRTFTTPPAPPSAPTAVVEAPQATVGGFKLKGQINPDSEATSYHFEFGPTTSYGTNLPEPDATIPAGANAVAVSEEVTGLQPNTTYHYKIVASNAKGPGESGDQAFTTPALKPIVTSLPVTESAEGFTLNGSVNPNGATTTYHYDFGVTEGYGESIPASEASVGSGSSAVSVPQLVTGLPPGVPYHYRLVAHNSGGTSTGEDIFFMTPEEKSSGGGGGATGVVPTPTPAPPSNAISARAGIGKGGKASLSVVVPGAGTLSVSGKQIKALKIDATGAGTMPLTVKLSAAGKKALKKAHGHRLSVKLTIVFTPVGGGPGTTHKAIVFK